MNARWMLVASLLSPALVRAEPPRTPADAVEYGFDDEMVKGDLYAPDVEIFRVRRGAHKTSLVEVRASYLRELLKSVEDL